MALGTNKQFFQQFKSQTVVDKPTSGPYILLEIISVSINNTGNTVVVSRTDKSIRVWKITGTKLVEAKTIENAHEKSVERVSWHPKHDHTFASVGRDAHVRIWRALTGLMEQEIKIEKWHLQEPLACQFVDFSPDGAVLLVVDRDGTISFLDVSNNYKKVHELVVEEHIYDLKWFNAGRFFALALYNGSVPIYEYTETASLRKTLTGHRSSITCIQMDPRGSYFAVGSNEGVVSIYLCSSLLLEKVYTQVDEAVSCIGISRDGTYIAVGFDSSQDVRIIDYFTDEEAFTVPKSTNGKAVLPSVTWSPNRTSFLYSSNSCTQLTLMFKSA